MVSTHTFHPTHTHVLVFYGGLLVRNGEMTSGALVSFLLYLQSLSDAFSSIGWVFSSLTQAVGAADKVFELLNRKPRYRAPSTHATPGASRHSGIRGVDASKTRGYRMSGRRPEGAARGEIVLENVELCYPARPNRQVLNKLSLQIEAGTVVALVGQSGSGKSSVLALLQHLYEQSSGTVRVDGTEVHELNPEWLSRNISIVSQEPTLFARSIKRNIMYGLEGTEMEPSDEDIEEAARLANASFIYDFPMKFETEVGERGVQLSGGQKQRIAMYVSVFVSRWLLRSRVLSTLSFFSQCSCPCAQAQNTTGTHQGVSRSLDSGLFMFSHRYSLTARRGNFGVGRRKVSVCL
jgi:ATP-binding cassette subfamily B (MDR/TAP) protein 9